MAKGNLTTVDDVRCRLRSFDRAHLDGLYQKSRYLMGETNVGRAGLGEIFVGDDNFPVYPAIVVRGREIGKSRRILNASILTLSRVMAADPEPQFTQVDATTAELRKQFFLKRYRGGLWGRELEQAFIDGDQLGVGVVQLGARRSRESGEQYVHATHVPVVQVIYDPLEPSLGRSTWVAFVHYIQPERAYAMFGEEKCKPHVRTLYQTTGADTKQHHYVRVTEYFDLGYGHGYDQSDPTMTTFVGPWDTEPVVRQASPYPQLPCAWYEYITPPSVKRPIGKIELELSTAEQINDLERRLRRTVKEGVGFDILDMQALNAEDVERVRRGEPNVIVRLEKAVTGQPYVRVPDREVGSALVQLFTIAERQWNADSQQTEMDRGSAAATVRPATETAILDQRSQMQGIYTKREALRMAQRLVERAMMVAGAIDRHPVDVDLHGHNITLNDPQDPRLSIAELLAEPSEILINPQSMEGVDTARKQAEELGKLETLKEFLGIPGGIPLRWFLERKLRAIGEEDVDEVLGSADAAPVMGMPGAPVAMSGMVPGQPGGDPAQMAAMMSQVAGASTQ